MIPNSVTSTADESPAESESSTRIRATPHAVRGLCLTRYYTHKNLEVLLEVADTLLERGRTEIGLFLTVAPTHGASARRFLRELGRGERGRVLHNLGQIPMQSVASCYQACDALILPSLMESFTNTYVDAMAAGVPIITSDMDFARTVCGPVADYVDPLDPAAIITSLDSLVADRKTWGERCARGRIRARDFFMDWSTIADRVVEMLRCVAQGRNVRHLLDEPWVRETIQLPWLADTADRAGR